MYSILGHYKIGADYAVVKNVDGDTHYKDKKAFNPTMTHLGSNDNN
jgi:hypothetical protein